MFYDLELPQRNVPIFHSKLRGEHWGSSELVCLLNYLKQSNPPYTYLQRSCVRASLELRNEQYIVYSKDILNSLSNLFFIFLKSSYLRFSRYNPSIQLFYLIITSSYYNYVEILFNDKTTLFTNWINFLSMSFIVHYQSLLLLQKILQHYKNIIYNKYNKRLVTVLFKTLWYSFS